MNHRRGNAVASEKEGLGERKKRGTRKEDEFYVQRHPHSGDKVVTDATRAGRRYTSSVAANNDNKRVMQNVHLVASIAGRKYKEIRVIGKGTFGSAVLCKRIGFNKLCVIKKVDVSDMDVKECDEALNEVNILASLQHPNIITYHESFISNGSLHIVLDYADGGDLAAKIKQRKSEMEAKGLARVPGRRNRSSLSGKTRQGSVQRSLGFPEEQVLHWFTQLTMALVYLHGKNILHRDLKTQNIFLTSYGQIKLGDFGIAKVLQSPTEYAKTVVGTPYYLSPELCEDKPYNAKSDIWALGCVLYELTTMQHAFDARNMCALVLKILRGKYPPLVIARSPSHPGYSRSLAHLVDSMLQRNTRKRPSIFEISRLPLIQNWVRQMEPMERIVTHNSIMSMGLHIEGHQKPVRRAEIERGRRIHDGDRERSTKYCGRKGGRPRCSKRGLVNGISQCRQETELDQGQRGTHWQRQDQIERQQTQHREELTGRQERKPHIRQDTKYKKHHGREELAEQEEGLRRREQIEQIKLERRTKDEYHTPEEAVMQRMQREADRHRQRQAGLLNRLSCAAVNPAPTVSQNASTTPVPETSKVISEPTHRVLNIMEEYVDEELSTITERIEANDENSVFQHYLDSMKHPNSDSDVVSTEKELHVPTIPTVPKVQGNVQEDMKQGSDENNTYLGDDIATGIIDKDRNLHRVSNADGGCHGMGGDGLVPEKTKARDSSRKNGPEESPPPRSMQYAIAFDRQGRVVDGHEMHKRQQQSQLFSHKMTTDAVSRKPPLPPRKGGGSTRVLVAATEAAAAVGGRGRLRDGAPSPGFQKFTHASRMRDVTAFARKRVSQSEALRNKIALERRRQRKNEKALAGYHRREAYRRRARQFKQQARKHKREVQRVHQSVLKEHKKKVSGAKAKIDVKDLRQRARAQRAKDRSSEVEIEIFGGCGDGAQEGEHTMIGHDYQEQEQNGGEDPDDGTNSIASDPPASATNNRHYSSRSSSDSRPTRRKRRRWNKEKKIMLRSRQDEGKESERDTITHQHKHSWNVPRASIKPDIPDSRKGKGNRKYDWDFEIYVAGRDTNDSREEKINDRIDPTTCEEDDKVNEHEDIDGWQGREHLVAGTVKEEHNHKGEEEEEEEEEGKRGETIIFEESIISDLIEESLPLGDDEEEFLKEVEMTPGFVDSEGLVGESTQVDSGNDSDMVGDVESLEDSDESQSDLEEAGNAAEQARNGGGGELTGKQMEEVLDRLRMCEALTKIQTPAVDETNATTATVVACKTGLDEKKERKETTTYERERNGNTTKTERKESVEDEEEEKEVALARVKHLRAKCIEGLGEDKFKRVYHFLASLSGLDGMETASASTSMSVLGAKQGPDDDDEFGLSKAIQQQLMKLVGPEGITFLARIQLLLAMETQATEVVV